MMKKILIIITTSFVPYGGLTTVVMNYYRAMDKTQINIDIASTNQAPQVLIDELIQNNSRYYCLGERKKLLNYNKNLYKVLKNKYDVIHVNGNSSTMLIELLSAIIAKIPIRIAHVHTTKSNYPFLNCLLKPLFRKTYNKAVAVSKDAGNWLFKKNYIVLNNAIDIDKYSFCPETRDSVRKQLGIEEKTFVIGNIGKLNYSKNQQYLIQVFAELHSILQDTKLLIVGGGELESVLRKQVQELNLQQNIIFTGMVDDASRYIQAFDYFAFTSRFEGLGLALIESQASGLKCIISDKVPNEAIVTNNVKVCSIEGQCMEWAQYILENRIYNRAEFCRLAKVSIKNNGYDIKSEAKKLERIYLAK